MKTLQLILFLFLTCACSILEGERSAQVSIRVENISEHDFQAVLVNTSSNELNFGDLEAGATSAYEVVDVAYRYAYIQLKIGGEQYILQPIDYVGETPLENGNYTYQINATDLSGTYGTLSLNLVED